MRCLSRIVAVVMTAMLLLPGVLEVSAQEATPTTKVEQFDLAAMALTPTELDDLGYADYLIADGRSQTLEDRVTEQTTSSNNPDEIRAFLAGLGWIRGYRSRLAHPVEAGTEDFDALVSSGITQFADEDGAHRGWELISNLDTNSGGATLVEDAETIGDESRIIDVGETTFDGGEPHPGMRIVFRTGTLVGDLIVFGVPGESVVQADVEALATRQLARMTDVVENGAPGLGLDALRWQGIGLTDPDIDNYVKLDGETFVGLGDTEQDIAQMEKNNADASDYYQYEASLSSTVFQFTRVARFSDETTAEAWVNNAYDRTVTDLPEGAALEQLSDAPSFGDGSTVLRAISTSEGGIVTGIAVFMRFGSVGVNLVIGQYDPIESTAGSASPEAAPDITSLLALSTLVVDDVIEMAQAQADCFEAHSCAESVPLPDWIDA